MIKLFNGRGQLGEELKKQCSTLPVPNREVLIYHTWNVDDKSKEVQKREYEKFIDFVDTNNNKKIIFVSTYSEKENWYNHFKQLSEAYLSLNCDSGVSLRIPTVIGKGILKKIKNNETNAYGEMELITIKHACMQILNYVNYDGLIRNFRINGEKISAVTIESIFKDV